MRKGTYIAEHAPETLGDTFPGLVGPPMRYRVCTADGRFTVGIFASFSMASFFKTVANADAGRKHGPWYVRPLYKEDDR